MKKINAKPPTNFDTLESIDYIWDVLCDYRENCIPEDIDNHNDIWDEICTSMAWIEEALGMKHGKPVETGYPEWKLDKDLEDRNRNEAMQRFTNRLFGHQTKRSSE